MSVDTRGRRAAQALLQAGERLGPPPDLDRLRRRRRRRAAGRAGLAAAAVAAVAALGGQALPRLERIAPDPAPPVAAPATTLARPGGRSLDPHVRQVIDTGETARSEVAAGPSGVWVLNQHGDPPDELVRVDPGSGRVVARIGVGHNTARPVVAPDGLVWLTRAGPGADRPELLMVNPATNQVGLTVPLPRADLGEGTRGLLVAWEAVWVVDGRGRLLRVALPVREAQPVAGAEDVAWLADAGGWVWATSGGSLLRISAVDGRVDATILSPHPAASAPSGALVADQDSLWLGGTGANGGALLVRLDPGTGQPTAVVNLASRAERYRPKVAVGHRAVAVRVGKELHLVDAATDSIRATVALGNTTGGVAADADTVWATDPTRGRLLRIDPGF
jgi:hypothetical protein